MHVTMIKKTLESGEPCQKCAQAEELLRRRGLWERIDEVVVADVRDPSSTGYRLAAQYGIDLAPFPNVGAYVGRVAARPKVQQAMREEGLIQ